MENNQPETIMRNGIPEYRGPPQWAKLPEAPINASPVPHLTSLYHNDDPGPFGDRKYPGNCGGGLIKDLMTFFSPKLVLDPMSGSGTCQQVCAQLRIPCIVRDMNDGFDATDPAHFQELHATFDFIWVHPPYWRQKLYTNDSRDLSRCESLDAFLARYEQFIRNCHGALSRNGRLAILMGDYTDRDAGFAPLTYHTKRLAFAAGFRQACTDIIRFSHGASSSRKIYRTSFIPGLHDVCMVFQRID